MKNIIIFGEIGSGKDSVADYLVSNHGYRKIKLGEFIRKNVDQMFSYIDSDKRREYYQIYGEGMRKLFGANLWNKVLFENSVKEKEGPFVIADARQPHELEYWKDFYVLGIDSLFDKRIKRISKRDGVNIDLDSLNHPTEESVRSILKDISSGKIEGRMIYNSESIEKLYYQIDKIIESMV